MAFEVIFGHKSATDLARESIRSPYDAFFSILLKKRVN